MKKQTHISFKFNDILDDAYATIKILQKKSQELINYKTLSTKILHLHYIFLDKRLENGAEITDLNSYELMKNNIQFESRLPNFYFYRIKSIIFLGANHHEEFRDYSLKALKYNESIGHSLRDDFIMRLMSINNYLDACIHLVDTDSYLNLKPKLDALIDNSINKNSKANNAIAEQYRLCCELNYLWITQDFENFNKTFKQSHDTLIACSQYHRPNTAAEILLGFSRMFFLGKDFDKAQKMQLHIDTYPN